MRYELDAGWIFLFQCISNRLLNEISLSVWRFVWQNVGIWNSVDVRQCFVDEISVRMYKERRSSKFKENHHLRSISSHFCVHHSNDFCSFWMYECLFKNQFTTAFKFLMIFAFSPPSLLNFVPLSVGFFDLFFPNLWFEGTHT